MHPFNILTNHYQDQLYGNPIEIGLFVYKLMFILIYSIVNNQVTIIDFIRLLRVKSVLYKNKRLVKLCLPA